MHYSVTSMTLTEIVGFRFKNARFRANISKQHTRDLSSTFFLLNENVFVCTTEQRRNETEKHLNRFWSWMKAFQSPAVLYNFNQSDKRHQGYRIYFVKKNVCLLISLPGEQEKHFTGWENRTKEQPGPWTKRVNPSKA